MSGYKTDGQTDKRQVIRQKNIRTEGYKTDEQKNRRQVIRQKNTNIRKQKAGSGCRLSAFLLGSDETLQGLLYLDFGEGLEDVTFLDVVEVGE